jgi:hypothetical protein
MTGIAKPGVQSRFDDTAPRIAEALFGALDSLQEYILVRWAPGALPEHLDMLMAGYDARRDRVVLDCKA